MRRPQILPPFLFMLICAEQVAAQDITALAWLAGCWANVQAEAGSGETWQSLAGGTMLGVGRTVKNGKTLEYEFLRLHRDEQQRIVYTAIPSGQRETSFVASQVTEAMASFENPAHDFPQKIVYRREPPAGMVVSIEGERQGKRRVIEFRFSRMACPG
jgi:Domain of unknown function (DUF6265)